MRQKYTFLAITIDEVQPQQVVYKNAIGRSTQPLTYQFRSEQLLDLSELESGRSYYIEAEDFGTKHACYIWTAATKLSKKKVGMLYDAHQRNGKARQYEPLPAELKYAIMRWGLDGWRGWLLAKDWAEGENPSTNAVLIATVDQPDVRETTLNDIEKILMTFRANELLEF